MFARLPAISAARSARSAMWSNCVARGSGPFGEDARGHALPRSRRWLKARSRSASDGAAPGRDGALRHPGACHRGARCGSAAARAAGPAQGTRCPHCRGHGLRHLARHAGRRRRGEQRRAQAEADFQSAALKRQNVREGTMTRLVVAAMTLLIVRWLRLWRPRAIAAR